MIFNTHFGLEDKHAVLSPSNYHWLRYNEEKCRTVYSNIQAKHTGTKLHEFAKKCIELNWKQIRNSETVNMYINDAIRYKMTPEQVLYFSDNCFGTADAISCNNGLLRIHDLKTGTTPASFDQLLIYAAIFFLEYREFNVEKTDVELRIYQTGEKHIYKPTADEIKVVMEHIKLMDRIIEEMKEV